MENVQSITVGNIYQGKVTRVKPFGALVILPNGQQGLVHISHVSNKFVENIDEHIKSGEEVNVKVLSIDEENNKIALSIKETIEKPKFQNKPQRNFDNKKSNNEKNSNDFEDKISEWLKSSNETQTTLNRRNKRR